MNRRPVWIGIAIVCLLAGAVAFGSNRFFQSTCTATNASGQRVVIGTELTPRGKQYKRENPADDNSTILEALGARGPELAWTSESIARCRLLLGVTGSIRWPLLALTAVFAFLAVRAGAARERIAERRQARVFISYSHSDSEAAERLRRLLAEGGAEVIIDSENMMPGERISEFIRRAVREADTVVSIVSSRSLLSAWVAMETILSLQRNEGTQHREFIACYLDEAFLKDVYRLEGTRLIDERLGRIEELLRQYTAERLDPIDLNEEKTRLYELRNNLGVILATLKDSLCLDIRDPRFEESGRRLLTAIRSAHDEGGEERSRALSGKPRLQ